MFRTQMPLRLLFTLLLASSATAKTVTVSPGGNHPTIQAGVDAAAPGDTVRVKAGRYQERVLITKVGLTLEGAGKVTLDALPQSGDTETYAIFIDADDVTIRRLDIRNAKSPGPGIAGNGILAFSANLLLEDLEISNCDGTGIGLPARDGATIRNCRIRDCQYGIRAEADDLTLIDLQISRPLSRGIDIEGSGTRIESCAIEHSGSRGVSLLGDEILVRDCTIVGSADQGIRVDGDGARLVGNTLDTIYDHAIEVEGDRSRVLDNRIRHAWQNGILLAGNQNEIRDNSIAGAHGNGIDVSGQDCLVRGNEVQETGARGLRMNGDGFAILDNDLRDASQGFAALFVVSGSNGVIADNEIRRAGAGVLLGNQTSSIEVRGNRASECGEQGFPAYLIAGATHTVQGNTARRGGNDGFRVSGSGHKLFDNRAFDNGADGIDLFSGSLHQVRDNQLLRNGGEGIEVSADNTQILRNECRDNRLDLANDGQGNSFGANDFITGGADVPGELD